MIALEHRLEMTVCPLSIFGNDTNKSEIYSRRNSGQIELGKCLFSFNLEYFGLLTKNIKMKHAELLILPAVLCMCETCYHIVTEEQ